MSTKAEELAAALEFHGRFGSEDEQQAAKRRVKRNAEAAAELRRLAEIERQYLALKASIGEPVAWHSPDETEGVTGLVWLRENGGIFLGYYFDQPFREYRDTDGHYVGQQDAETYWARHEDGEPCNPDGWCELLPPLYAIKDKQP